MTIVKAIKIDNDTRDETLRVLNAVLSDRKVGVGISPSKVALSLGITESRVRYNVKKLVFLGYLRVVGKCYEPTDKVLFLNNKG